MPPDAITSLSTSNHRLTALFLATKTTNNPISLESYAAHIPRTSPSDVLELEFLVAQSLGFDFAVWHAYAKLRLHSDGTLALFDDSLRSVGFLLRLFKSKVCAEYPARELPSEDAARTRYGNTQSEQRLRELKLDTYKIHSMGHYTPSVREIGTFENTSTQLVCTIP